MEAEVETALREPHPQCDPTSNVVCQKGCWFLFTNAGCKQGLRCPYCHNTVCSLLADMRRREFRREQSRRRPSKKKRDRLSRCQKDTGNSLPAFDRPLDLRLSVLLESTESAELTQSPDNLGKIQDLLDAITRGS